LRVMAQEGWLTKALAPESKYPAMASHVITADREIQLDRFIFAVDSRMTLLFFIQDPTKNAT
jgi:hypothetical protein